MTFDPMTIVWFIVTLGVLITVHEFGHYWVARRAGVKVLRFSVGFGAPLYTRRFGADGTAFVIGVLPLGGYVKMLGDDIDAPVAPAEQTRAFNRQSLGVRAAIVAAGPLINIAFAVLAFWAMYVIGVTGLSPKLLRNLTLRPLILCAVLLRGFALRNLPLLHIHSHFPSVSSLHLIPHRDRR